MRHKMLIGLCVCAFNGALLAGCASQAVPPPTSRLMSPSPRLMVPPQDLPAVPARADAFTSDARCSTTYVEEAGKLKSLQGYVRTIQKKRN